MLLVNHEKDTYPMLGSAWQQQGPTVDAIVALIILIMALEPEHNKRDMGARVHGEHGTYEGYVVSVANRERTHTEALGQDARLVKGLHKYII